MLEKHIPDRTLSLVIRDDDVISEYWTHGQYEIDGHFSDKESGGKLVLSPITFSSKSQVVEYLHKNFPATEWMHDIFRIIQIQEYTLLRKDEH